MVRRVLITALLAPAFNVVSAKQEIAELSVFATVVYPALIKTRDNGTLIAEGERIYSIVESYAADGSKLIVILY